MPKRTKYQGLGILPISVNFSDLDVESESDELTYDTGDDGKQAEEMYDTLELENSIFQILNNLNDREKVIFLYQLVRESGYRLDHESCAETMHIKRQWYMTMLGHVKYKAKIILKEYSKYKDRL